MEKDEIKAAHIAGRYQLFGVIITVIVAPLLFLLIERSCSKEELVPEKVEQVDDQIEEQDHLPQETTDQPNYETPPTEPDEPIAATPPVQERAIPPSSSSSIVLSGIVIDENQNGIANAVVRFGSITTETDKNGAFHLNCSNLSEQRLKVVKDGFISYSEYRVPKENLEIELSKK